LPLSQFFSKPVSPNNRRLHHEERSPPFLHPEERFWARLEGRRAARPNSSIESLNPLYLLQKAAKFRSSFETLLCSPFDEGKRKCVKHWIAVMNASNIESAA
jgi:hypothetical protein